MENQNQTKTQQQEKKSTSSLDISSYEKAAIGPNWISVFKEDEDEIESNEDKMEWNKLSHFTVLWGKPISKQQKTNK